MSAQQRIAMFLDFENLVYGLENNEPREGGREIGLDVERLVRFARDEGRLIVARAYADWRSPAVRQHQRDLYVQGIEPINVFGRRYDNEVKNSVDVALCVDAVESLFVREYDTFVLISGDRDFLPLLRCVRSHGKRVIGVSVRESASRDLPNLCDRFVYYRDLWAAYGPEERREGVSEGQIRDFEVLKERIRELLVEEVGVSGVLGASLKPLIRNRIDPGFDETRFGFVKFSKLLEAMSDVLSFEYTNDLQGGDIRVFARGIGVEDGVVGLEAAAGTPAGERRRISAPLLAPGVVGSAQVSAGASADANGPISLESFLNRARARLDRTGLHIDRAVRLDVLESVFAALPQAGEHRGQADIIESLEGRQSAGGRELDHETLRRYLWALYQSFVFDIHPDDRRLHHLERRLQLKTEFRSVDALSTRLDQSLVYKVWELLPTDPELRLDYTMALLEYDEGEDSQALARKQLERVENTRKMF
ncbi:NYN domain-containing protein [Pseudenhygromyxa sp. WMMC2535]|uniref:NYN domain-containing protein n=1 Tax=Pseudenhygromyxa sp. WMMC2535 TaxID=2712867 RepID=UPI001557926D|nr:NYN domain-containing protein [Pseudenhygromyxa sp. WMMC2535]NVB42969.1 NYN domain-containing protein [Pseudenhygromyxa sp. WMMC2535]